MLPKILIAALIVIPTASAKETSMPRPDQPPRGFKPGKATPQMKPTHYETFQAADGSWGLRPTAFKPGTVDKALIPHIKVHPIQRRVTRITKDGNRPL